MRTDAERRQRGDRGDTNGGGWGWEEARGLRNRRQIEWTRGRWPDSGCPLNSNLFYRYLPTSGPANFNIRTARQLSHDRMMGFEGGVSAGGRRDNPRINSAVAGFS